MLQRCNAAPLHRAISIALACTFIRPHWRFHNRNKFARERAPRSHRVACECKNSGEAQENRPQRIRKRADEVHTSERKFFVGKNRAHRRGDVRKRKNACKSRPAHAAPRMRRKTAVFASVRSVAFIALARLR
ncbi:hypothetical protein [Lysobacter enzymogenes]|uniref:hypothetical protein n=1 Tax=Lysobacter enzymogenes TaxID=69 RepID=UPI0011AB58A7|nr:hypothetical protein [Lysobacter enzymogenes]